MFERYTERARRVIFFARYEASQFGSTTIETEHLLLGLLREDRTLINRVLPEPPAEAKVRAEIEKHLTVREKIGTSIDLPLSNECKRILAYSAEEAERLNHRHIGTAHLFLGMLREENCLAAQVLYGYGLRPRGVRDELARHPMLDELESSHDFPEAFSPMYRVPPRSGHVPDADTAIRIAEAIWIPLYGIETIKSQAPLKAELKHDVWTVTGTPPEGQTEGPLFAFILRLDGRILSVGRCDKE